MASAAPAGVRVEAPRSPRGRARSNVASGKGMRSARAITNSAALSEPRAPSISSETSMQITVVANTASGCRHTTTGPKSRSTAHRQDCSQCAPTPTVRQHNQCLRSRRGQIPRSSRQPTWEIPRSAAKEGARDRFDQRSPLSQEPPQSIEPNTSYAVPREISSDYCGPGRADSSGVDRQDPNDPRSKFSG